MDAPYIKLGIIKQVQGLQGQVLALLTYPIEGLEAIKNLFIQLDHTFVPYQVVHCQVLHNQATIQFQGINDRTKAYSLKGKSIFIHPDDLPKQVSAKSSGLNLVGYQVSDQIQGALGAVDRIVNLPLQQLLVVNYLSQELLIPYNQALIHDIDHTSKHLVVNLPPGFIEAVIGSPSRL